MTETNPAPESPKAPSEPPALTPEPARPAEAANAPEAVKPAAPASPSGPATPAAEAAQPSEPAAPAPSSPELLQKFFRDAPAAKTAAHSLKKAAEVRVQFTDAPGEWRFTAETGAPELKKEACKEPDFDLLFGPAAVRALVEKGGADVGDLGIQFFTQMLAHEPEAKIKVKLHSGLLKLTMRGYLGVLASGGPKVIGWMANKGLKGPGAVANALSKLKKG